MKIIRIILTILSITTVFSNLSSAHAAIDNNASTVQVRLNCTENGAALNNCFTDLATMNNWVFNVRSPAPSVESPVLVEIGPGQFNGNFVCSDSGFVTLRGSGMQNTIINAAVYPVAVTNCKNMTFMNMTLKTGSLGVQGGASTTFWHDVELDVGGFYAWLDSAGSGCYGPKGKHYWFNSRITGRGTANGSTTYQSECDESWFFGSEITKVASGNSGTEYAVKSSKKRGETHIYGGVVRVISQGNTSATKMVAIHTENTGVIHIHGTGIDAIGSGANTVIALSAITSGEIHANETAYNLSTGVGGTIKRVSKDTTGHIHAPYQWETHPDVPFANNPDITFESLTGYDIAIVTTKVGGVTDHPHMVVYDSTCNSKWFDTTINQCR